MTIEQQALLDEGLKEVYNKVDYLIHIVRNGDIPYGALVSAAKETEEMYGKIRSSYLNYCEGPDIVDESNYTAIARYFEGITKDLEAGTIANTTLIDLMNDILVRINSILIGM